MQKWKFPQFFGPLTTDFLLHQEYKLLLFVQVISFELGEIGTCHAPLSRFENIELGGSGNGLKIKERLRKMGQNRFVRVGGAKFWHFGGWAPTSDLGSVFKRYPYRTVEARQPNFINRRVGRIWNERRRAADGRPWRSLRARDSRRRRHEAHHAVLKCSNLCTNLYIRRFFIASQQKRVKKLCSNFLLTMHTLL